jgi:hypothetical protein
MKLPTASRHRLAQLRPPKFQLWQLFASTTFFGLAVGIVTFNNSLRGYDIDLRHALFLLSIPAVGAATGAGIGVFWRRTQRTAILGAIAAAVLIGSLVILGKIFDR